MAVELEPETLPHHSDPLLLATDWATQAPIITTTILNLPRLPSGTEQRSCRASRAVPVRRRATRCSMMIPAFTPPLRTQPLRSSNNSSSSNNHSEELVPMLALPAAHSLARAQISRRCTHPVAINNSSSSSNNTITPTRIRTRIITTIITITMRRRISTAARYGRPPPTRSTRSTSRTIIRIRTHTIRRLAAVAMFRPSRITCTTATARRRIDCTSNEAPALSVLTHNHSPSSETNRNPLQCTQVCSLAWLLTITILPRSFSPPIISNSRSSSSNRSLATRCTTSWWELDQDHRRRSRQSHCPARPRPCRRSAACWMDRLQQEEHRIFHTSNWPLCPLLWWFAPRRWVEASAALAASHPSSNSPCNTCSSNSHCNSSNMQFISSNITTRSIIRIISCSIRRTLRRTPRWLMPRPRPEAHMPMAVRCSPSPRWPTRYWTSECAGRRRGREPFNSFAKMWTMTIVSSIIWTSNEWI